MKTLGFSRQNDPMNVCDNSQNDYQIKQGMSSNEIAEVVSEHLINVVKQQFEIAKEEFREKNEAKNK